MVAQFLIIILREIYDWKNRNWNVAYCDLPIIKFQKALIDWINLSFFSFFLSFFLVLVFLHNKLFLPFDSM